MPSSEMKLLMETWRSFEKKLSEGSHSPVVLFENNKRREIDFITLIERKDITDAELTNILTESYDHELKEALEEGMIGDFISGTLGKAKSLVARGKLQGLMLFNKLKDTVYNFKSEHPTIFKAAIIILGAAAAYLAIDFLLNPEAQAVVTDMPMETQELIVGTLQEFGSAAQEEGATDTYVAIQNSITAFQRAHQTAAEMEFSEFAQSLKDASEAAHQALYQGMEAARDVSRSAVEAGEGSEEAATLDKLISTGKMILQSK